MNRFPIICSAPVFSGELMLFGIPGAFFAVITLIVVLVMPARRRREADGVRQRGHE